MGEELMTRYYNGRYLGSYSSQYKTLMAKFARIKGSARETEMQPADWRLREMKEKYPTVDLDEAEYFHSWETGEVPAWESNVEAIEDEADGLIEQQIEQQYPEPGSCDAMDKLDEQYLDDRAGLYCILEWEKNVEKWQNWTGVKGVEREKARQAAKDARIRERREQRAAVTTCERAAAKRNALLWVTKLGKTADGWM